MMLSQDVFSSLARRPRHKRRRELPIRTSSPGSRLLPNYLSGASRPPYLRIDMLYRL